MMKPEECAQAEMVNNKSGKSQSSKAFESGQSLKAGPFLPYLGIVKRLCIWLSFRANNCLKNKKRQWVGLGNPKHSTFTYLYIQL